MPPRRAPRLKRPQQSARGKASTSKQHTAADIYSELLAEATSESEIPDHAESRPLKRRKAGPQNASAGSTITSKGKGRETADVANTHQTYHPTAIDTDTPADDVLSDSELAFEDVVLDASSPIYLDSDEDIEDVNISLGQNAEHAGPTAGARRRAGPRLEKHLRVLGHKAHLLTLMGHCTIVNSRCNDPRVQKALKLVLSQTAQSYLRPSKDHTQFQQDRTFTMGIQRAFEAFKDAYTVSAPGMRRAHWQGDSKSTASLEVMDRKDFIKAARQMTGSQDTGNQLFCAMLRSAGVKTRLVCSLQVLPLANTTSAPGTSSKAFKTAVFAIAPDRPLEPVDRSNTNLRDRATASARSRIGAPAFHDETAVSSPVATRTRPYYKLGYPVFWVEVFNGAYQKWVCVDPVVTQTIGKPSRIEPPLQSDENQLVYAIAFAKNGSAKDVTRRYAKAYNAKTRRLRLESAGEPETFWLRKVMRMFQRRTLSDADRIEETELAQKVGREGLPNNIQDFKGHPLYALERHLKRHEVIHPHREAGKINAGTAANPKMESIFRREDVHVCRSADQWFRHGRTVKPGEQTLKLVPARMKRKGSDDESDHEQANTTALYILSQTELYIPKPVVRGKVPRNGFGNLDIYVPSMVPAGGTHIRHSQAKLAAEVLEIDAVDAVVGFKFSARKGTTVIEGAIVPAQYAEAVYAVIDGLLWQDLDERCRARSALAMRMWKRLLQGLKIAERVASYATGPLPKKDDNQDPTASSAWYADEDIPLHTAGRFTLDGLVSMAKSAKSSKPAKKKRRLSPDSDETDTMDDITSDEDAFTVEDNPHHDQHDHMEGGFVVDDSHNDMGGGFLTKESSEEKLIDLQTDEQGGFMPEDTSQHHGQQGGGFLPASEHEMNHSHAPTTTAQDIIAITSDDTDRSCAADVPVRSRMHVRTTITTNSNLRRSVEAQVSRPAINHEPPRAAMAFAKGSARQLHAQTRSRTSDEDSLLSHDPDDEDAEPDWMESD